jgi:methyl-accepting chemotaxis protein
LLETIPFHLRGYEMKRFLVFALLWTAIVTFASCGGEEMTYDAAIEKATFTEIEQALPGARDALTDLDELINKRMPSRYRDEALEDFTAVREFVDIVQFYYLPILNARAHISRAYREIGFGMYTEASDDIQDAIDNLNKAALKSTPGTQAGFEEVKRGLTEIGAVSDETSQANMLALSNAAKKLNMLIEKIKPTVVMTEEGEALIEGQL